MFSGQTWASSALLWPNHPCTTGEPSSDTGCQSDTWWPKNQARETKVEEAGDRKTSWRCSSYQETGFLM